MAFLVAYLNFKYGCFFIVTGLSFQPRTLICTNNVFFGNETKGFSM